ncbi:MAG: T9SS type A sorting domain-containing protein [Rhodothermales bacterium]
MKKNDPRRIIYFVLFLCISLFSVMLTLPSHEVGVLKAKKADKQTTKKARADYFQRMLRDPHTGEIPANIRRLELLHAATMPKRADGLSKNGAMPQFSWEEAGPVDVGGRTRGLAVDVANSNTIIAGGVSGGIWKSTDKGASWSLKSDPEDSPGITHIAQDTRSGNTNKWYATTGEFSGSNSDRGFRSFYYGQGVLTSTDNGESWQMITPSTQDPTVFDSAFDYHSKVLVSPSSGNVFFASNGFGLNRSTGNILTMSSVLGNEIFAMWTDFDIAPDGTIIAVISDGFVSSQTGEQAGVYKSTDDGITWTEITPAGFPDAPDRSVIAMAPSNPNVAYMLTYTGSISNSGNAFGEVEEMLFYKFDVGAGTSQNLTANLPDFAGEVGDVYSQGGYNMVIAVKPNDANHVIIGGTNLYVSRDGFATQPTNATTGWVGGYATANNISPYNNHHPDQHALFFDPQDPNALWSGHDGGLSYIPDVTTTGAFAWQNKNNGYNVTQYYHVALPADPDDDRLLGGTQDNGSPFFSFDPTTLTTSPSDDVSSGDGAYAFMGDTYAIASTQSGDISAYSYTNGGDLQFLGDITPAGANNQLFINPFVTDPIEETIIYYPAGKSLWRRNAGSASNNQWAQLGSLQLSGSYSYSALAASASGGSTVLYLASSGSDVVPQIHRFDNAGSSTAAPVNVSIPNPQPAGQEGSHEDAYIHSIAVNPNNANEVLVAMSNYNIVGLYHSSNAGASWTAVEGNLTGSSNAPGPSLRSVAILPLAGDTGYLVGTSTGFYSTILLNGNNTTWQQEAADAMGNVIVESIATRTSDGRVALATHGRGVFVGMPLIPVANEEEAPVQPSLFSLNQNYPNPFNPSTSISFTLTQPSRVSLTIFDVAGREVKTLISSESKAPGVHNIAFDAGSLASGSYLYELEAVSLATSATIQKESRMMSLAK